MDNLLIGASLSGFKGLNIDKAIDLYLKLSATFNLKVVEIRFEKERQRPAVWPWEVKESLKEFLGKFKIVGVHLPFVYLNPISHNPYIKEASLVQLKLAIEKASNLNVNYCVMHARGFNRALSLEQEFNEWKKVIEELVEFAEEKYVLLTLENADSLHDLHLLAKLVKQINSKWLKITLDVGHAHIRKVRPLSTYPVKDSILRISDIFLPLSLTKKNMPYEKYGSLSNFIKSEKDLVAVIHVHDYNGRRDHLPIGEGKINFSFLSELKEFKGPYILEVEFKNHYEDFKRTYTRLMGLLRR